MNQSTINFGAIERDKGIARAVKNADAVHEDWSDKAYECFKMFLKWRTGNFLCEDYRDFSKGILPEPPSLRAYGHVIRRAAKDGLIVKVDHSSVKNANAHMALAGVWRKV